MTEKLPKGWKSAQIGKLCNLINGKAFKPEDWKTSGLPIIRIQNLNNKTAAFNYFEGVPEPKHLVQNGQLLFAWSGTPGTSFGAHVWTGPTGVLNQHIFKIEFDEKILDKVFFRHAINQKLDELINIAQGGVGLRHVTKGKFENTQINFPPIDEQKQIVARLDQLLARVDSCRAHLDRAAAAIKRFRQSVLNAAVTGQLTYELNLTTNKNLEQIADYLSKQSNLKKNETDKLTVSLDYDLPPHWCTAPLGLLISACSYGSSQKSAKTGLIPVLRMGNIQSGILDWEDLVYTSDQTEIDKYLLEPGDVLFNRTNSPELVGKTAMYKEGAPKAIYAGYLIRVKTLPALNPQFLTYCLNSSYGRHFSWQVKTDGVSQSNINASKLCAFPTPICSRTEQDEIVRRAEALFQKAYEMESKLTAARERVDNLTASILAKAFRGELVAASSVTKKKTETSAAF